MDNTLFSLVHFISTSVREDTHARLEENSAAIDNHLLDSFAQAADAGNNSDPAGTASVTLPVELMPPYMVALGGVAGASKTTLCRRLSRQLNEAVGTQLRRLGGTFPIVSAPQVASPLTVLPMDGYHHYRKDLDKMADPAEAHRRRGAPYTFNSEKYHKDMGQLKRTGLLSAPHFNHEDRDPEEDFYKVDARSRALLHTDADTCKRQIDSSSSSSSEQQQQQQRKCAMFIRPVVLVEGIYALFDTSSAKDDKEGGGDVNWAQALALFDKLVYLRVENIDVATMRLARRHRQVWPEYSESDAIARASGSDRDNGLLVIAAAEKLVSEMGDKKLLVLNSVDDETFVKESQ